MEPMTDLKQVLAYLSLGGAAVVAATFASILLEKWDRFTRLAYGAKLAITMSISLALGLGATALLTLPEAALQAAQPYFAAAVMSLAPFIIQEVAHKFLKKAPATTVTTTSVEPASTSTTVTTDTPPAAG